MTKHFFIFISDNFKYAGSTVDYDARKILHSYMNRVTIDENDQHEILSYHELVDASWTHVSPTEKCEYDKNFITKVRSSIFIWQRTFYTNIYEVLYNIVYII